LFQEDYMIKIKVIVADKQPAFREGLCRLLAENADMEIVGQAVDGEELIALAEKLKPDVIVADVALPKINGIDAIKRIRVISPETAVLGTSSFESQTLTLAALRAGGAGFLTKDTPIKDFVNAVRLAHAGSGIIERSAAESIIKSFAAAKEGKKAPGLDLQPREVEVLRQAAKGLRNKEIAKELGISERTVQSHLSNIFSKLGVDSRTEAILKALKQGWLDISDLN
jgi:DNA-binding NarL/FixJ family response regulator